MRVHDSELAEAARLFWRARIEAYRTESPEAWLEVRATKELLYEILEEDASGV